MFVVIRESYEQMSRAAAARIAARIRARECLVLGLATGSTPLGIYRELSAMFDRGEISFRGVTAFNLDEYYGLGSDHPRSYRRFMDENFFSRVDIMPENTFIPDGKTSDFRTHCAEYEKKIAAAGGIDLQVLGIGGDGHIAFNEPGASLGSRTRLVVLGERTIRDNARFFSDVSAVPRFALSMGVGTILEAREVVLLASGENKAGIVARALEGPITSQVTASALQMHPEVTVFLDEPAAAGLEKADNYRFFEKSWREVSGERE